LKSPKWPAKTLIILENNKISKRIFWKVQIGLQTSYMDTLIKIIEGIKFWKITRFQRGITEFLITDNKYFLKSNT
jgi:hypothetical protein